MDVAQFKKQPILGIMRGIEAGDVDPLVETIIASGLRTIEITMNTPGAPDLIRSAVKYANGELCIGAGTVLSVKDLEAARKAGATFIVMPVVMDEVMKQCAKHRVPVFPGALTPQEIYRAWTSGAAMVKVFPAKCFGPDYFREIKGPFNDVELLACAGVTPENMKEYFSAGASAVSFGASVFRRDWLLSRDFPAIKRAIERYILAFNALAHSA